MRVINFDKINVMYIYYLKSSLINVLYIRIYTYMYKPCFPDKRADLKISLTMNFKDGFNISPSQKYVVLKKYTQALYNAGQAIITNIK